LPTISRFYGIVIGMYFEDHAPPHFHARCAEFRVRIALDGFAVLSGSMPRRALRLIREWARAHLSELEDDWQRAQDGRPLQPIDPLR
jgi:hypothetical protein